MRTTLDIDEAVLAAARALVAETSTSIGAAVSTLARRGLAAGGPVRHENGFPVFQPAPDAPPITLELVNAHRDG